MSVACPPKPNSRGFFAWYQHHYQNQRKTPCRCAWLMKSFPLKLITHYKIYDYNFKNVIFKYINGWYEEHFEIICIWSSSGYWRLERGSLGLVVCPVWPVLITTMPVWTVKITVNYSQSYPIPGLSKIELVVLILDARVAGPTFDHAVISGAKIRVTH